MDKGQSDISRLVWPEDGNRLAWLDRLESILSVATKAGAAYLGFQAFEKVVPGTGLSGAIVSQIALRLAEAGNIPAGAAGVATLTGLGILNVASPELFTVKGREDWIRSLLPTEMIQKLFYTPGEYDPYTGRFD